MISISRPKPPELGSQRHPPCAAAAAGANVPAGHVPVPGTRTMAANDKNSSGRRCCSALDLVTTLERALRLEVEHNPEPVGNKRHCLPRNHTEASDEPLL
jgi:hypothetical protein